MSDRGPYCLLTSCSIKFGKHLENEVLTEYSFKFGKHLDEEVGACSLCQMGIWFKLYDEFGDLYHKIFEAYVTI